MMDILEEHNINGRDKPGGSDKATIHTYVDAYEKYLSPYVNTNCSVLEIGVWEGGSSLLWQEFLSPKEICAVDIDDYIKIRDKLNSSFKFYLRNAYTQDTVSLIKNDFPKGFDIIIEDGLHTEESNRFSIYNYLPMLKSGGIMVIEDIPANTAIEVPFGYTLITPSVIEQTLAWIPEGYEIDVLDFTQEKGRYDDILFIIKKP